MLAAPDHPAFGMGMFHRLPQTMQTLELMPESFRTGLGHDYDSHGPEGAVGIERSFEPWNRTFLLPIVLPALDGVVEQADGGCDRGRRRLRCRRRGAADGRARSQPAASPATTSPSTRCDRAERAARRGRASPTRTFHDPRDAADAGRPLRRPRHDVRLHPRHDRSAGDDGRHPRGRSPTTARGCSSTSRPGTRSPRTSRRTRWHR